MSGAWPPKVKVTYTRHALAVLEERGLEAAWVEATLLRPDCTAPDPAGAGTRRYDRSIPERDGRVMRVVAVESGDERRILTVFLDRRARRPQ